jgi:hypothetical protein
MVICDLQPAAIIVQLDTAQAPTTFEALPRGPPPSLTVASRSSETPSKPLRHRHDDNHTLQELDRGSADEEA